MTTDEAGQLLAYDAWGRIFTVNTDGTGSAEITYAYDALFRRIKETVSGTTIDLYHSPQWQVVEERSGSTTKAQNIWSAVYVDALVLRDRDANNTGGDGIGDGGLEQRLYVLQDANFNVTALVDTSGVVQERYIYDPYGTRSVLDANWSADADGISDYAFNWGHQGGRHDLTAGLVHFRFRDLDTSLGRWSRQDPASYIDGPNLYIVNAAAPIVGRDPVGLCDVGEVGAGIEVDLCGFFGGEGGFGIVIMTDPPTGPTSELAQAWSTFPVAAWTATA